MKASVICLVLLSLLAQCGCKSSPSEPEPDPKPAAAPLTGANDQLAQAHGFWEWQQNVRMNGTITPAETGFTRQLIFKADGYLDIYHSRQLALQPTFTLRTGMLSSCGGSIVLPLVEYIAEPQIANNILRYYRLSFSATDTTLVITGEKMCVDGGAMEYYRWHRL